MKQLLLTLAMSLASTLAAAAPPIRAADPYILVHEGTYYLHGTDDPDTKGGIKVYRSRDLLAWEGPVGVHRGGYALKRGDAFGRSDFWNGSVVFHGGRFLMHYTANEHLALASAPSPLGPFTNPRKAAFRTDIKEIDNDVFIDEDGTPYFYFVRFDKGNVTYAARMKPDLSNIEESTVAEAVRATLPWEHTQPNPDPKRNWPVAEGTSLVKRNGTYYLFYTANDFRNPDYAVGMSTAPHPLGPWTKYAGNPILKSALGLRGTGSTQVFRDLQGRWQFVFHAHAPTSRNDKPDAWAKDCSPRHAVIQEGQWQPDPAGGPDVLRPVGTPRVLELTTPTKDAK